MARLNLQQAQDLIEHKRRTMPTRRAYDAGLDRDELIKIGVQVTNERSGCAALLGALLMAAVTVGAIL